MSVKLKYIAVSQKTFYTISYKNTKKTIKFCNKINNCYKLFVFFHSHFANLYFFHPTNLNKKLLLYYFVNLNNKLPE